jgi:S1-C subfamily serine protease
MRTRWLPLFFLFTSLSALAQEPLRADLEKMYREVSDKSIPKTVCLTANLPQGEVAIGSGAVVSADGYILTCAHVLEAAENLGDNTLGALFPNGKTLEARTLGRDSKKDFVLLKVDAENLPFFEWGDSSQIKSGEWVLALGHPIGIVGIQGRRNRIPALSYGNILTLNAQLKVVTESGGKDYGGSLLSNIPLAFGNSGGPLVNSKGKLIGLNGAISRGVTIQAYSVPSNRMSAAFPKLKKGIDLSVPSKGKFNTFLEGLKSMFQSGAAPPVVVGSGDDRLERIPPGNRKLLRKVSRSVVQVYRDGDEVAYGLVVDEKGQVVTSRHALLGEDGWDYLVNRFKGFLRNNDTLKELLRGFLKKKPVYEVEIRSGIRWSAELVKEDRHRDLAFLKFTAGEELISVSPWEGEPLQRGSFVSSVGPRGEVHGVGLLSTNGTRIDSIMAIPLNLQDMIQILQNNLSALEKRSYPRILFHDAVIPMGQFGSAVVDREGRVLGMNVFSPLRGAVYAIPMEEIWKSFRAEEE